MVGGSFGFLEDSFDEQFLIAALVVDQSRVSHPARFMFVAGSWGRPCRTLLGVRAWLYSAMWIFTCNGRRARLSWAHTQVEIPQPVVRKAWPHWLPMVCRQREWFASAAIRIGTPEDGSIWRLSFAQKSPFLACFVRLRPLADICEALSVCGREAIIAAEWQHGFQVDLSEWVWTNDEPFDLMAPFVALPGLVYGGAEQFVVDGDWVEIDELRSMFLASSDPDPEEQDEVTKKSALAPEPSVFERFPWLLEYLNENPWVQAECGATAEDFNGTSKKQVHTTDAEATEIFDLLMNKRAEWETNEAAERSHFTVELLGGRWTAANLGVAYDAFRGACRGGDAEAWCDRFGLQKSFRCGLRQVPEEIAHLICTEWCRNMQWLFDKWQAEGDAVDYSDEALTAFRESADIAKTFEASATGPARERIGKVRSLRPRAVA